MLLVALVLLKIVGPARAGQQLTDGQKELIAITRLPELAISFSFFYQTEDFDEGRWGDRAARISGLIKKLAGMDAAADPLAGAGTNYEIALLLTYDKREPEARPHRETALQLYQDALAKGPRSAKVLYQAGLARNLLGSDTDAKVSQEFFSEALKTDQGFCMPYVQFR